MSNRLNQLKIFLEESPNAPFILFAIAKEHEKLGNLPEAGDFYQKLIKAHPDYVGTYFHYGHYLEELDQPEQALAIYTKGIEIAQQAGDLHAKSELMSAKTNLELEL